MINPLPEVMQSKTPKAYKNKKLNNANFGDFNHTDYQVFLHLVSKIGGVDKLGKYLQPEQLQREHKLTAKEFSEVFNTPLSHSYGILKKAVDKLMKTDIRIERIAEIEQDENEEKIEGLEKIKTKKRIWRINVCSQAEYNENEGKITIEFTDRIMPYLAQVRQKFVLYNLKEISNFGSLYTTRLYELLREFQETGWMLKSVEQLREAFAVGNKFKTYSNFKRRTFEPACKEINNIYDINLSFEEFKERKKVTVVKFSFKPTIAIRRLDQEGVMHNTYKKPIVKKQVVIERKERTAAVLKDQLSFESLEDQNKFEPSGVESAQGLKSIGSIFNNLFQKVGVRKNKKLEKREDSSSRIVKEKQPTANILKEFGLNTKTIDKIIKENSEQIIQDAIKAVDLQISKGHVRNPEAMLVTAIKEKWHPEQYKTK